jgi:hypothetical protein
MSIPNPVITKIPNNEPDAIPALWNTRYDEIDVNFSNLDSRLVSKEDEVTTARGGKASLGVRLAEMTSSISATSVDMQDASTAALKYALSQAAQANYSVQALKQQIQQEGEVTIQNKGVISGCSVTKSSTAARNLSLVGGFCFANGRLYSVADAINTGSVPSNTSTTSSVMVYAYLMQDANGLWRLAVTPIGTVVPAVGILVYTIIVPVNSTDASDPNLTNVALTDVRRIEPQFPTCLDSPASVSPVINTLSANDYKLDFDVVSSVGPCDERSMVVSSRATNGFTVQLASAADSVVIRWRASKLNN